MPSQPTEPAAAARGPQFASVATRGGTAASHRHIVSFKGSVPADFAAQVAALGGKVLWVSPGSGLAAVRGLQGSGAAKLAGKQGIQAVEADALLALDVPRLAMDATAEGGGVASNAAPAAAVRYSRQWNMRAVQADVAWSHGFLGSDAVSIFMLDSGIDYLHADLLGRVDLTRSVDLLDTLYVPVVNANGDTVIVRFVEADTVRHYFPDRLPFTDLFFHGTHTAATVSSNAARTAGVTSRTKLVAVKVCAYINDCPFSSILNGVIYAADNGADVINLSVGGAFTKAGNGRFVGLINKVFNYARSKGVTTVVSAGNEGIDLDHNGNTYQTFCDTPAVICVAATGPTTDATGLTIASGPWTDVDAPAFYTNFGRSAIDVAAPGGNGSFGPDLSPPRRIRADGRPGGYGSSPRDAISRTLAYGPADRPGRVVREGHLHQAERHARLGLPARSHRIGSLAARHAAPRHEVRGGQPRRLFPGISAEHRRPEQSSVRPADGVWRSSGRPGARVRVLHDPRGGDWIGARRELRARGAVAGLRTAGVPLHADHHPGGDSRRPRGADVGRGWVGAGPPPRLVAGARAPRLGYVQQVVRPLAHRDGRDHLVAPGIDHRDLIRPSIGRVEPSSVGRQRNAPRPPPHHNGIDHRPASDVHHAHARGGPLGEIREPPVRTERDTNRPGLPVADRELGDHAVAGDVDDGDVAPRLGRHPDAGAVGGEGAREIGRAHV